MVSSTKIHPSVILHLLFSLSYNNSSVSQHLNNKYLQNTIRGHVPLEKKPLGPAENTAHTHGVHSLVCWSRRCQRCRRGSHPAQSRSWAGPRPVSSVSSSACWGWPCYTESGSDREREADHTVTKAKWGTGEHSGCIQVWAAAAQLFVQSRGLLTKEINLMYN